MLPAWLNHLGGFKSFGPQGSFQAFFSRFFKGVREEFIRELDFLNSCGSYRSPNNQLFHGKEVRQVHCTLLSVFGDRTFVSIFVNCDKGEIRFRDFETTLSIFHLSQHGTDPDFQIQRH